MDAGRATVEQALTQLRDDIRAERANGRGVVHKAFHLERDPARHINRVFCCEARDLREVVERHDARHDGDGDAALSDFIDEVKVGVGIEEKLSDRRVRASLGFGDEIVEVGFSVTALRVVLGVGRDFDHEVVFVLLADEAHEIGGIGEVTHRARTAGHIATQGDDAANAFCLVQRKCFSNALLRCADAGKMRRGGVARFDYFKHGGKRLVARRAARAVSYAEKLG